MSNDGPTVLKFLYQSLLIKIFYNLLEIDLLHLDKQQTLVFLKTEVLLSPI